MRTVKAYTVSQAGLLTSTRVAIDESGKPVDSYGTPLHDDGTVQRLVGWKCTLCRSYENGKLLIPMEARKP